MKLSKPLKLHYSSLNRMLAFCLIITFANCLDPDQACSGSKLFDTLMVFLNAFFEIK